VHSNWLHLLAAVVCQVSKGLRQLEGAHVMAVCSSLCLPAHLGVSPRLLLLLLCCCCCCCVMQVESLTTIYLENNPAAAAPDYKQRMLALLPKLQQLDANVLPERD
jgi:hypothetical protein